MIYDPTKNYCVAIDEQVAEDCDRRFLRVGIGGVIVMTLILVSIIGL